MKKTGKKPTGRKRKGGNKGWAVVAFSVLLVIAFVAMMWFRPSGNGNERRKDRDRPAGTAKAPEFRKDGTLSFFVSQTRDTVTIDIEVADHQEEIMRGLMYRPQMDEYRGMLFVFPGEEQRSFWMKNTYISLDILFVDNDRKIVKVQESTQPLSTEAVLSYRPAKYVIEVNAGFAARHGIREGDKVSFSF